jgi:DNA-binding XRE family transcriptional regulator
MRMRLPSADVPPRSRAASSPLRPLDGASGGIDVAGRDANIGHIFRNMRAAMRLPREAVARRLATTPTTIDDFENGAVSSLPRWPETVRIVRSYCEILRLDPEPILWRIHRQLQTAGPFADSPTRSGPPGVPPALLRKDQPRSHAPGGRRRRRSARRLFAFSTPIAIAAAALYFAQAAPAPIYRAIAVLPQPVEGGARAVMDNILLLTAPRRDGLRWIDVGDPRLRKVDKLQTSVR